MTDKPRWNIQLIQISEQKGQNCYIPYSIGLLQAYALRHAADLSRYTFLPFLHQRLPLAESLAQSRLGQVYGFSVYVWNINYSLALAAAIKARQPDALIVFGGPQVPDRAEAFLRAHPQVDVCVHGEGEGVFLQLLEGLPAPDWAAIPGLSRIEDGVFRHTPPGPRLRELDRIPSPYLTGVFDGLLQKRGIVWQVIWETTRGCPFSCTFCDWGSATAAKVNRYGFERLTAEIDWFVRRGFELISLCDANFGILPRDEELVDYIVAVHARTGRPASLFLQSAKNAAERSFRIHKKLLDAGIGTQVTMAMQSLTPDVLRQIRRENISLDTFATLQLRFTEAGIPTYNDLLVGLPGETYDSFVDSVCQLLTAGQHYWISYYNVFVLPNAEMGQPAYRARHGLETVEIPYTEPGFPVQSEIHEYQEMVVATASLSRPDWRRIRAFAWWSLILCYNFKLLQLPLLTLHRIGGLSWRSLLEWFSEGHSVNTPMLADLRQFLLDQARLQQEGRALYCQINRPGKSDWITAENFVYTGLGQQAVAQQFFAEAGEALQQLVAREGVALPEGLLEESLAVARAQMLCLTQQQPFRLPGRYNLWKCYQAWLRQQPAQLRTQPCVYERDWFQEPLFELRVLPDRQLLRPQPATFSNRPGGT